MMNIDETLALHNVFFQRIGSVAQDAAAHTAQLEALLAQIQETIAEQEQTIENLAADNALLKRSLFGSRPERFADDPAQTLLFESNSPDSPQPGLPYGIHAEALTKIANRRSIRFTEWTATKSLLPAAITSKIRF